MADENEPNGTFITISRREIFQSFQRIEQEVRGLRTDMTNILSENVELRKRVRSLELKYYAVLAGLVGALVASIGITARLG